jgi:ABC-type multidrug transport system fused ATPase/permease subunit
VQFAAFGAFAIVLGYGARLILAGAMTTGNLTSFLLYTLSIASSVGTLGALYAGVRDLQGASGRVFDLLETRSDIVDGPGAPLAAVGARGRVELRDAGLRYPGSAERWGVRGVHLQVQPGEVVAFVGPSGAGKTTIFSLLLRYYDATEGAVEIDGVDVRKLRLRDLRQAIGVVPQDVMLFDGTIEENLRYGDLSASSEQLRSAAAAAGADRFIEALPQGWQTRVGERGVKLSTGQRQRLAIARAFLRNPSILLLDEATSALDAESEELVQQALDGAMGSRTTIIVAHRLATARRADRIVMVDGGAIVASGEHATLVQTCARYRNFWELQTGAFAAA